MLTRDLVGSQLTGDLAGRGVLLLGLVFVAAVYLMPRGLAGLRGWYDRRHRPARAVH